MSNSLCHAAELLQQIIAITLQTVIVKLTITVISTKTREIDQSVTLTKNREVQTLQRYFLFSVKETTAKCDSFFVPNIFVKALRSV